MALDNLNDLEAKGEDISQEETRDKKEISDKDFSEFKNSIGTQFRNFDSETLRWATKKAETMKGHGKTIDDMTKLFSFHNEVWGKYNEMIARVPLKKRDEFLKLFLDILYGEKHGKTHEQKLKKVEAIGIAIDGFFKYQTLARFEVAKKVKIGKIMQSTLDILHDETPEQFKSVAKNLGNNFFKNAPKATTRNLSNLKIESDPAKFYERFKTIKDLEKFFKTIKNSATEDAKDLIDSTNFSRKERNTFMAELGKLDENNPIAIFKFISDLTEKRDARVEETKKEEKAKKLEEKKEKEGNSDEVSEELGSANEKRKPESLEKKEETEEKDEESYESVDKLKQIEVIEKSMKHAKEVKKTARDIGLPITGKYWTDKNARIGLLKEFGQWDHYKKLNAGDPNIPSNSKRMDGETLRPRWVNYSTKPSNYAESDNTCKHLDKLKDSGYELSTMMGFFSVDWRDDNSPLYTPDDFISKMEFELAKLKGTTVSNVSKN